MSITYQDLGIAFVGDASKLQQAAAKAGEGVENFGRRARGEMRGVSDEADRTGDAMNRLANGIKGAFVGSSVAVGLITMKNLAVSAVSALIDAQVKLDRVTNSMNFGAGGAEAGAREMAFLRAEVNRLGLDLNSTSAQYAKMVAAARGSAMQGEATRNVFTAIAEASTVMGMNAEQNERAFMAVTQMMSKGKVMAEELRGQLGEHLPGAFSIAARAMGVTEVELNKLLETGQVFSADFLPKFAAQLRKELGESVDGSTMSMQANINRLNSAWLDFKQQLSQGGLGEAIKGQINTLSTEVSFLGDVLEMSRQRGDGFWETMANTTGAAAGRVGFQLLNDSIHLVGTAIGPMNQGLSQAMLAFDAIPDNLKPVAQQMEITEQKMEQARVKFAQLTADLARQPDSIWTQSQIASLQLYIAKLQEAQAEQRRLMGIGASASGDQSGAESARLGRYNMAAAASIKLREGQLAARDKFLQQYATPQQKAAEEIKAARLAMGDLFTPDYERMINEKWVKPIKGAGRAARAARDEFAELFNKLTMKDAGLDPSFYTDLNTLYQGWQKSGRGVDEYRKAVEALIGNQQFAKDIERERADAVAAAAKSNNDAWDAEWEALEKARLANEAQIKTGREMLEQIEFETSLIGMNSAERERATALRELERAGVVKGTQAYEAYAEAITNAQAIRSAQQQMADDWETINSTANSVFLDIATNGEDAFKRIGESIQREVLQTLYELTAKKWLVQMSGMPGLGGPDSLLTQAIGGRMGSSLLGNAGSLGSLGSMAAGFGTSVASGSAALFAGQGVGAMANAGALIGTGTATGIATGIGTAIGVALPVAAIALGLSAALNKKLKAEGFEVQVDAGVVGDASRYTTRGSLLGGNSTRRTAAGAAGDAFEAQVAATIAASRSMARALGAASDGMGDFTGSVRVNLRGVKDAAEAQQRMQQAMDDLQFKMLEGAAGFGMTRDAFGQMMEGVRAQMDSVGISASSISDVLLNGMMQGLGAEQTGAQLADVIVGGIYRSIAQQYTQQIAQAFMAQIVTPIFTAMAAGVPISQAISQASIDNMVANAQAAADALNAILNSEAIRGAIAAIGEAAAKVGYEFGSIEIPEFGGMAAFSAAASEANDAAAKANAIMQERFALEGQILTLLGKTTQLRERELAAMDASLHPLQRQVWLIEDTKAAAEAATDAVRRAVDAQKELMAAQIDGYQTQMDAARELEDLWNDVFGTLRDARIAMRGEVASTRQMAAEEGQRQLAAMLSGELTVSSDAVREAVAAVEAGIAQTVYTSAVERDRTRLIAANQFEALEKLAGNQLSSAEQQVVALEDAVALLESQMESLDLQTQLAEDALNAALGIDTSVKTVAQAVADQTAALAGYTAAVSSTMTDAFLSVVEAVSSNSGGGGGGGWGGWSGGGQSSSPVWTASGYLAKNPDVAAEFENNSGRKGWPAELNTAAAYAEWHWKNYGQKENRSYLGGGFTGYGPRTGGVDGMGGFPAILHPNETVIDHQRGGIMGDSAIPLLRAILARLEKMEANTGSTAEATTATAEATASTDKRLKSLIRQAPHDGPALKMVEAV